MSRDTSIPFCRTTEWPGFYLTPSLWNGTIRMLFQTDPNGASRVSPNSDIRLSTVMICSQAPEFFGHFGNGRQTANQASHRDDCHSSQATAYPAALACFALLETSG